MNEEMAKVDDSSVNEGFSLMELITIIKNNLIYIILTTVVFFVLGFVYTNYFVTPMYTSSIDMIIYVADTETSGTDTARMTTADKVAENIKEFIKFKDIIEDVIDQENLTYEWHYIRDHITTNDIGAATAVTVTYEDSSPLRARQIVIALARELAENINTKVPGQDPDALRFASETITLQNEPDMDANQAPSSPNKLLYYVISILLGLIVGVGFIFIKETLSTRYNSKNEVERVLQLPVIALIPQLENNGEKHV
ncbi:MAG: YveK family protein [Bacilli bacterium]